MVEQYLQLAIQFIKQYLQLAIQFIEQYLQLAIQFIEEIWLQLNTMFGLEETQAFKFLKPYLLQVQDNPTYMGIAIALMALLPYSLYKIISIPRKRRNKLNERENELDNRENKLSEHENELEQKLIEREMKCNGRERKLKKREKNVQERENKLNEREKNLNELKDGMEDEEEGIDRCDPRVIEKKDYDQAVAYSKQGNYKKAFLFYKNAAEHDYAKAQLELGNLYYRGQGVVQSYEKAFYWYRKSADQGNADAQSNLSEMYRISDDLEEEYESDRIDQQSQLKTNQDKEAIAALKKFIQERDIDELIHFTRYENLESILENGIVTRDVLNSLNRDFYVNDSKRLDGHQNSTSVSVTFPNWKMFYKYRMQSDATGWVVISIKPEVLWEYDCAFCKHNAADSRISKRNIDDLCNIKSFEEMFLDDPAGTRLEESLEPCDPTDPQAEVLVFNNIPIKHIQEVGFENEYLLEFAESEYNKDVASNISFVLAEHYFKPRECVR